MLPDALFDSVNEISAACSEPVVAGVTGAAAAARRIWTDNLFGA
jgi:hypothetical protein